VVRAFGEGGRPAALASTEILLTLVFFVSAILYARLTRQSQPRPQ